MTATYMIDGDATGKARLDVLSAVCAPGTNALLDRVGVPKAAHCLDVGCGGGHISRELARRVGGRVSVSQACASVGMGMPRVIQAWGRKS